MSASADLHSLPEPGSGRIALAVTLAAETVFFATVLVAYAALRGQSAWNIQHSLGRLALPLANTAILLASALAAWRSLAAIRGGQAARMRGWLLAALLLGLVFVAGQALEFSRSGMHISDPAFGGVFFTLMSFHAVHVLAGVVFLALNLGRGWLGDFTAGRHEAVQLGAWFWYYVTAVWLVLFTGLYLL